jgi:hypothetical protein
MQNALTKPPARGPHPLLRGNTQHRDIWTYFELAKADERGMTAAELRDALKLPHHIAMARVTEMVNEGLLVPTGQMRLLPPRYQRSGKVYTRVKEGETAHGRDQIKVSFEIRVNEYGEYSLGRCEIVGQTPHEAANASRGILQTVATSTTTVRVPRPTEAFAIRRRAVSDVVSKDLTITDVEYTVES